ncbi:YsnF/AvaK domain-containing protein [Ideonella sp. BN130291]|uniref:YsnF/AvaK domain-containing protein n=1 Tax=Ideonella sp. BN130291 TaxID=3112940 RepID=UPI002E267E32|nr:YsnF/AvaK domain-containing protein [Ideonella sp. BN130291]
MELPAGRTGVQTIPVIEEELQVTRERVDTGAVRVRIESHDAVEPLRTETWTESVEVERVAIGRTVDARLAPWQEGDVMVVPVYEERWVVQRVLVLAEQVRIRKRGERSVEEQQIHLRKERAVVERRTGDGAWAADDDSMQRQAAAAPFPRPKES